MRAECFSSASSEDPDLLTKLSSQAGTHFSCLVPESVLSGSEVPVILPLSLYPTYRSSGPSSVTTVGVTMATLVVSRRLSLDQQSRAARPLPELWRSF